MRKYTRKQERESVALYGRGLDVKAISPRTGVAMKDIMVLLVKAGYPMLPQKGAFGRTLDVPIVRKVKVTKDPLDALFDIYKAGAASREIAFDLGRAHFGVLALMPCYYCGQPPSRRRVTATKTAVCNGIDRLDNAFGYSFDNCVPCCTPCNMAKGTRDATSYYLHCLSVVTHTRQRDQHTEPASMRRLSTMAAMPHFLRYKIPG
jgi:hypothetical protein